MGNCMKKRIDEYDVVRVIATLLVVLGHCDMIASHGFSVEQTLSTDLTSFVFFNRTIRQWIYSFHMPCFMILSGALFATVKEKYSFKQFTANRIKRLLIPFLLCNVLYAFPIRYLCGYFADDSFIKALIKAIVALPGHLWFLWVLFVISIVIALLIYHVPTECNNCIWGGYGDIAFDLLYSA